MALNQGGDVGLASPPPSPQVKSSQGMEESLNEYLSQIAGSRTFTR